MDIVATELATGRRTKKLKFVKTKFGVAIIVYLGKLRKKKQGLQKPDFGSGSRLCVRKVLAPHNIRPKTL